MISHDEVWFHTRWVKLLSKARYSCLSQINRKYREILVSVEKNSRDVSFLMRQLNRKLQRSALDATIGQKTQLSALGATVEQEISEPIFGCDIWRKNSRGQLWMQQFDRKLKIHQLWLRQLNRKLRNTDLDATIRQETQKTVSFGCDNWTGNSEEATFLVRHLNRKFQMRGMGATQVYNNIKVLVTAPWSRGWTRYIVHWVGR